MDLNTKNHVNNQTALNILMIFIGAGIGGVLRYTIGGGVQSITGASFPFGTLTCNVLGCLVIGFLGAAFAGPILIPEQYRLGILVGILGGFTTFSSFGNETFSLMTDSQWLYAGLNLTLSNALGLIGVWAGVTLSHRIYGV